MGHRWTQMDTDKKRGRSGVSGIFVAMFFLRPAGIGSLGVDAGVRGVLTGSE
jgi:hypothetical protein